LRYAASHINGYRTVLGAGQQNFGPQPPQLSLIEKQAVCDAIRVIFGTANASLRQLSA
jgi:hypothetical protein